MSGWFENDEFWASFQDILFSHERAAQTPLEVFGLETRLGLVRGDRVLDLACGPGRHALGLAPRGFQLTGVDLSATYLDQLRAAAGSLPIEVVRADMRDFVRPGAFDAAYCFFTSFGYFDDPNDDLRVLRHVARSLRPGGRFLVDVLGKEVVARGFPERWWKWLTPTRLLLEERVVLDAWTRLETRWTLLSPSGTESFALRHRLYSAAELARAMAEAGFARVEVFGSLEGAPYDAHAWRLIAVGTTPEEPLEDLGD